MRRNYVKFRWVRPANDGECCTACGCKLKGDVVMLEYERHLRVYHQGGDWSERWKPFDRQCARREIKEYSAKILDEAIEIVRRSREGMT